MSTSPRRPRVKRLSSFRLVVTQRLRSSWTSSRLKKIQRRKAKAEQRLLLLKVELDYQHLQLKELQQTEQQLEHRQQEATESREYREQEQLPARRLLGPPPKLP